MEEFSPSVGWIDEADRSCLCLDVSVTAAWFGGESALIEHVIQWAIDRRMTGTLALADTLGAAWAVANYGLTCDGHSLATQMIASSETASAIAPLPIEALRLSPLMQSLLRELGLRTIGPLLSLSRDDLAERFDAQLLRRLDQALGNIPELFAAHQPPPRCEVSHSWETSITNTASLFFAWEHLLPRLLDPLEKRGRGVTRLLAELIGESRSTRRLVVGLLRPTFDPRWLLDLLQLRMETVRLCEPIIGTRLAILEEAPAAIQQRVLFQSLTPPIESSAWASLVERLTGRLGSHAVLRIDRRADHQPEHAWIAKPWVGAKATTSASPRRGKASGGAPPQIESMPLRPTLLLSEPHPIRVIAVAPQGYPQQFRNRGQESRVTRCWGPERIETGWWRGPSMRRDYYRVQTDTGTQCWLFRDLRTRQWFLHGWFD